MGADKSTVSMLKGVGQGHRGMGVAGADRPAGSPGNLTLHNY